ncbi:MAG: MCE family protein [Candidatus Sumerlaeia bacterium]|nr:MCE family protein [Candidatus Sumerlaeia bacterium]
MEKRKATADTIVGLFVLTGIVFLNLVTVLIREDIFGDTLRVRATFESVPGLEVGAPVLVSGIRAGRVTSIDYRPVNAAVARTQTNGATPQPVVVSMRVKKKVPIYTNARVNLVQQGFIGDKRVEIDPGSEVGGILLTDDADPLPGQPHFDMTLVMRRAEQVVDDLGETIAGFKQFVTDDETIASIRQTINSLNRSVERVYVYLDRNEENVTTAVANVREVSENLREVSARLAVFLEEGGRFDEISGDAQGMLAEVRAEVNRTLGKVQEAVDSINETVRRLDVRAGTISDSAVEFLSSTQGDFNALSENLQETSTSLNAIATGIRRGEGTVGRLMTDPAPFEDLKRSIEALHDFLVGGAPPRLPATVPYGVSRPQETKE